MTDDAGAEGANVAAAPPPDSNATVTASGVWTNRTRGTSASGRDYLAVASDASGLHLVATSDEGFWTSSNGGFSWTNVGGNSIGSLASNSTGAVVIGAEGCEGGTVLMWLLTSSGATWSSTRPTGFPAGVGPVAMDATGHRFVAAAWSGDIWTSSNSGATWTDRTPSGPAQVQIWTSLASSSTATHLVAIAGGSCPASPGPQSTGDIWTSTDSGATWIDRTPPTGPVHGAGFTAVASDSSGTNLVAVGTGIWTSADAGVTWTQQTVSSSTSGSNVWVSVASDASGKHLIAATWGGAGLSGNIFTSADAGVTWTNETAGTPAEGQSWNAVASDAAGVHLVAVAGVIGAPPGHQTGDIWTNGGDTPP
jgi:hypothetical protein